MSEILKWCKTAYLPFVWNLWLQSKHLIKQVSPEAKRAGRHSTFGDILTNGYNHESLQGVEIVGGMAPKITLWVTSKLFFCPRSGRDTIRRRLLRLRPLLSTAVPLSGTAHALRYHGTGPRANQSKPLCRWQGVIPNQYHLPPRKSSVARVQICASRSSITGPISTFVASVVSACGLKERRALFISMQRAP